MENKSFEVIFEALDLSSIWAAKLSPSHLPRWDAPIMFPFSFCLCFIASDHFYSLPFTLCSTLPDDLATVSISLLAASLTLSG